MGTKNTVLPFIAVGISFAERMIRVLDTSTGECQLEENTVRTAGMVEEEWSTVGYGRGRGGEGYCRIQYR